jgi:hypothetical protein
VRNYLFGFVVSPPKYMDHARLIESVVATLATDRAVLLHGVPGTAQCVNHDTHVLHPTQPEGSTPRM